MPQLIPIPDPKEDIYDFTPFLTAPTIRSTLPPHTPPTAIPIPDTLIASPLAPNLAPHTLLDLKEYLCGSRSSPGGAIAGNGRWTGPGSELGAEKGREIWQTWKRAWDLWNGFYIEGRVDASWIQGRYEEVKGELEEDRKRRVAGGFFSGGNKATANPNDDSGSDSEIERELDTGTDNFPLGVNTYFTRPVHRGIPPIPTLRPASEVADANGETGGFMPMKLLPDYAEPSPDADGNYPDWEDVIANTVWRPRRVGEKTLNIVIDEVWGIKSEFEFDGGVDCGRSPYPVLRYVIEYIKRDGCFRKKKVWDGVTGTIFNMPTLPLEGPGTPDEKRIHIAALYGDFMRDHPRNQRNENYFPLDIRRIDKVDPITLQRKAGTPFLEDGEEQVRWPWSNKPGYFHDLPKSDPWWVTREQEELREVPPRKYPPAKPPAGDGTILPIDDTIWKEEVENDDFYQSRYFVTNLHCGTLVVNGLEIKKGWIAGPLPDFAVIETPGNQMSFWFGPGGRKWRQGKEGISYASQWAALRRLEGWVNVGLTAGQVWDMKIRDRLRREFMGEEEEDDPQWEEWKKAEKSLALNESEQEKITTPLEKDIWNGLGTNPSTGKQTSLPEFSTEVEELQWLLTKAYPLKDVTPIMQADNLLEPPPAARWPGPYTSARPDQIAQRTAQQIWDSRRNEILHQQQGMNILLTKEKEARDRKKQRKVDAESRKRKAEGPTGPTAKKARFEAEVEGRSAQGERKAAILLEQEKQRKKQEDARVKRQKLQDEVQIAARIRREAEARGKEFLSEEEAVQIRSDYEAEQEQERMLRDMHEKALNDDRARQDLQQPFPDLVPLSKEDAQLSADAWQKEQEKVWRERAEEKGRKGAVKTQADVEEAAKAKRKEGTSAADQAVRKDIEKDAEERRQKFIADRKAWVEKKKIEDAEAAAKAEYVQYARLLRGKYGLSSQPGSALDEFNKSLSGQAQRRPSKPPSTQPRGVPDFASMTEEQKLEYAIWLSKQPRSPTKNSPDVSKMTYNEQIAYIMENTAEAFEKQASQKERQDLLSARLQSLLPEEGELGARIRIKAKADSENKTVLEYVRKHGFQTVEAYLHDQPHSAVLTKLPETGLHVDDSRDVLAVARYYIQAAAREGVGIRARIEGRTVKEIVKDKGYDTLEQYVQAMECSLKLEDMPPTPSLNEQGIPNTQEREKKWSTLCQRITDAKEFEYRIGALPRVSKPHKSRNGHVYAII